MYEKNHDTIRSLQNLATVSLIPSRNEPFGLVVIEGTACGHPVIASNSGGIPDIMNVSKKELQNEDIKFFMKELSPVMYPLFSKFSDLSKKMKLILLWLMLNLTQ